MSMSGVYVRKKIGGESYNAFIPSQLPLEPPIDLAPLYAHIENATRALAELNSLHKSIPNTSLFAYMYVRKEALLSSQIEGTQSSFSDLMLFENQQNPSVSIDDVEEVSNYVKAMLHGINRLNDNFPLSLRLIREIHEILLSGTRGETQLPGHFRTSQNWIGGTRPGNALFVPPPVEYLQDCLSNFEDFLHTESLPLTIKIGIAHVQFETIHPFLDGNGRLGRLLITLLLYHGGALDAPILYLSLYLKQNRQTYYSLLQEVRNYNKWGTWLEFFLNGITYCSKQSIQTAQHINQLFDEDYTHVQRLGRMRFVCTRILNSLKMLPQASVSSISKELDISAPTSRNALNTLVDLNIISEVSGLKRDKIYVYKRYLNILEYGTEKL